MAGFFPLYSGSTGNCTYIGSRGKGILIDAGASAKGILELLGEKQISPDSIVAIFITHEHADHIKGLGALLKLHGYLLRQLKTNPTAFAVGFFYLGSFPSPKIRIISLVKLMPSSSAGR